MNYSEMTSAQKIQDLKESMVSKAFDRRKNKDQQYSDTLVWAIDAVANGDFGFASEIAKTVMQYQNISEKQAYWIAKAAVENGKDVRYANLNF